MTDFVYQIVYDAVLGCFVWVYNGNGMSLGAETLEEAENEILSLIDNGIYPEDYYGQQDDL